MSSISEDSSSSSSSTSDSSSSSTSSSQVGGNPGDRSRSVGSVGNKISPIQELTRREINSRRGGAIGSSSHMEIIIPQLRDKEEQGALLPIHMPLQLVESSR